MPAVTDLATLDFPPAILRVKILSGSNLHDTDRLHAIDPYVEARLGADSSRSIALLRAGTDVVFDWSVSFPFDPSRAAEKYPDGLVLTVWDQDLGKHDDVVGSRGIPLKSILPCETKRRAYRGEVKLLRKGRLSLKGHVKEGGSVDVEVYWENLSVHQSILGNPADANNAGETQQDSAVVGVPLPQNFCVTNFNKLSGVAQTLIDNGRLKEYSPFRAYRMRMWHVPLVFDGYTKGWNEEYDAAQKIYGSHLSSKMLRAALRMQNFMAYSNEQTNRCQVHEIGGTRSLQQMLESYDGAQPNNQQPPSTTRYTYVVMPDSHMHFSVTSKRIATDFLSKHALHAGAAREVVYAGEFFFDTHSRRARESGKSALVIDNNSGTFAPPKERLGSLKLLMQLNFGTDMPILALDRSDPLLRELSDANGVE